MFKLAKERITLRNLFGWLFKPWWQSHSSIQTRWLCRSPLWGRRIFFASSRRVLLLSLATLLKCWSPWRRDIFLSCKVYMLLGWALVFFPRWLFYGVSLLVDNFYEIIGLSLVHASGHSVSHRVGLRRRLKVFFIASVSTVQFDQLSLVLLREFIKFLLKARVSEQLIPCQDCQNWRDCARTRRHVFDLIVRARWKRIQRLQICGHYTLRLRLLFGWLATSLLWAFLSLSRNFIVTIKYRLVRLRVFKHIGYRVLHYLGQFENGGVRISHFCHHLGLIRLHFPVVGEDGSNHVSVFANLEVLVQNSQLLFLCYCCECNCHDLKPFGLYFIHGGLHH